MNFAINSVILWPRKRDYSPRILPFRSGAVNIITGASRTGKSALIPIIDYCLGSDKCTIPVDVIRNACSWFGVLFDMEGEQILLCRREPGDKASTGDMFILRGKEITLPEYIEKNANVESIKDMLNELFAMSFLDLDSNASIFHPSYRDFMAFLFQPQNIVANADVLFYKADTMEHRKKLIDVFPYALGAVTPEILAKRKEIERLSKLSDRLQRDLNQIKTVAEGWKQEVAGWLSQAHEYGLTNYIPNSTDEFARQVDELRVISQKRITDVSVSPEHVADLSKDIAALRQEEQQISSELFSARKRYTDMLQLMQSMGKYDKSLQIQLDRLDISTWIRSNITERNILPIFQPSHENVMDDVNALCTALEQIEHSTTEMAVVPAAFEREIQNVQAQIQELADKLEAVQKRIRVESQSLAIQREESYTLESISRFLGRIDAAISTYERIGTDSELQAIVGLKLDGTVVAEGDNGRGQCNVGSWTDIVAIAAHNDNTIAIKSDGTVLVTGENRDGWRDIQEWKLFNNIDTLQQEREDAKKRWQEEQKRRDAERNRCTEEHTRQHAALEAEHTDLQTELANLKGLFTGKRRKEIEARLAEIEAELKKL